MSNGSDLLPHIIEMKESIARMETKLEGVPERVGKLEHAHTDLKARASTAGVISGALFSLVAWAAGHIWSRN